MVQVMQAQPTAKTLRQQAFQQGLDQIGQGVVGFANAMDQRTQREQALNIKAAEAMMRDGIEFTPENMQIIRSALSAQTPTGFSGLFPGLKSDEQKAAEAEQKKAEEEKAAAEAEAAAQNTQQGNVFSPQDGSQQIPNGNNFGMYNNMSGSVQQGNVQSPAFNGVQPGSANRQPSNMGVNVNINPGLNNQGYAQESQQRSPSGSFGKLTYTASKQAEMNRLKAQAEKDAYEARQLSLPIEQRDDFLKAVALEKAKAKFSGTDGNPVTAGQKSVDVKYGTHYNDFIGGGRANAQTTIKQLKIFQDQLKAEADSGDRFQSGGGRITAILPDAMRTTKSLSWKSEIPAKANLVLKKLFGGQLSDAEREAEANTYYNDLLSPEENARILGDKLEQLKNQFQQEDAKAAYFQKHKTLAGFVPQDIQDTSETKPPAAPVVIKTEDPNVRVVNGQEMIKVPGGWAPKR